jgi:hypothetical protein
VFIIFALCVCPAYAQDIFDAIDQSVAYYEKGDFRQAIKELKSVVNQLQDRPEDRLRNQGLFKANLYLGLSYLGMGKESSARAVFRDAVLIDPRKELDSELFSPKVLSLYNEVAEKTLSNLTIESNVVGAEVFLNNNKEGVTPAHILRLLPGGYAVRVVAGNQEAVKDVALEPGKGATLVADFQNLGFLSVTSDPSAATVSLENLEGGVTPLTREVPAGEYTVVVSQEGYMREQKQVLVTENETQTIHIKLSPATCSIGISSEPEYAIVYLDNINKGTTPLMIKDVSGGMHALKIEKDGYKTIEETIDVDQSFIEKTYYLLPRTGSLFISTDPEGAGVVIEGKHVGTAPLTVDDLAVKEHIIELGKEGYVTKTITASVVADKVSRVNETLVQLDTQPPIITFVPLEKVVKENKNYVKARVRDNKGVKNVFFIFTAGEWRYAHKIKMHEQTKGVFETLIPETLLKQTTMKYYISACDLHNNCSTEGSEQSPFMLEVKSIEPYTEGYILRIERDRDYDIRRLTVSIGAEDGVQNGDEYVVFRVGKKLKDPRTNEILQIEEILVGTIEITELLPRTAYAEVDDDYIPLKENDRIRKVAAIPEGVMTEGSYADKIILRWFPNTEPEVKGYRIYRSTTPNGTYRNVGRTRGRDNTVYKDHRDMKPGVTYYYRVSAYNILGKDSEMSKPAAGKTRGAR